jgi:hypothetical protein
LALAVLAVFSPPPQILLTEITLFLLLLHLLVGVLVEKAVVFQ